MISSKLQWIRNKILSQEDLTRHLHGIRTKGNKIVFTNGCFDLLHHGHLDYLSRAADLGNVLVIGLNSDASVKKIKGDSRPIHGELDRAFQLAALLVVEAVCLFEEDTPLHLITALKPDVLVKGGDYLPDDIVGAREVLAYGGKVETIPFVSGYSTTALIEKIKN